MCCEWSARYGLPLDQNIFASVNYVVKVGIRAFSYFIFKTKAPPKGEGPKTTSCSIWRRKKPRRYTCMFDSTILLGTYHKSSSLIPSIHLEESGRTTIILLLVYEGIRVRVWSSFPSLSFSEGFELSPSLLCSATIGQVGPFLVFLNLLSWVEPSLGGVGSLHEVIKSHVGNMYFLVRVNEDTGSQGYNIRSRVMIIMLC